MLNHTPGPWKVQHEFDNESSFITAGDEQEIAEVYPFDKLEGYANARLIAASPELFELGRYISHCVSIKGPCGTTAYLIKPGKMEKLRELINKLEGV